MHFSENSPVDCSDVAIDSTSDYLQVGAVLAGHSIINLAIIDEANYIAK